MFDMNPAQCFQNGSFRRLDFAEGIELFRAGDTREILPFSFQFLNTLDEVIIVYQSWYFRIIKSPSLEIPKQSTTMDFEKK